MEQSQFQPIVNFIWSVADDLLRDVYVKGKYRDVILPMTIIRRIDAVLEPTKDKVLKTYNTYKDEFENDVIINLNNQIKNPKINSDIFKAKIPQNYDIVR